MMLVIWMVKLKVRVSRGFCGESEVLSSDGDSARRINSCAVGLYRMIYLIVMLSERTG